MRQDNFPHPVSDPEVDGVPAYADDDSTAWDEIHSGREADGPDPAALPGDHPLAVDRFGTTGAEARLGESIEYKLARESSDPASEPPGTTGPTQPAETALVGDLTPIEPDRDSPVSMYDRPDRLTDPGRPVGRLVEPDAGSWVDDEPDAIAYDAGAAGGGPSAEELAMHEVDEPSASLGEP